MTYDNDAVRAVLDAARAEGRAALTAPEGKRITDAYGIPTPAEGLAESADEAVALADRIGFPVVLKIVSPDILHKTDAGGVRVGLTSCAEVRGAFTAIVDNARSYDPEARIQGVQVQQMIPDGGQEVIVGAVTDPTFGKVVAFGLGGVLVEVLKDITFRLAPATEDEALSMLDGIRAAEVLRGVRGGEAVDRAALADLIVRVSRLVTDFPEITEVDLNPVFATGSGVLAADVRLLIGDPAPQERRRYTREEILGAMQPADAAALGGGGGCLQRAGEDRQFGAAQPHRRRLLRRDPPGEPQSR